MFRAPRETRSLERLVALMRAEPGRAFTELRTTLGHAFVAWLAAAPLIVGVLYFAMLPAFRSLARRVAAARLKGAPDVA